MPELTLQQTFDLALQHHQAGRFAEAEALYRQILAVQPNQPDTLNLLGTLAVQVGQYEAAIELINQALVQRPQWPEALNNLGEVSRLAGQYEAAITVYQKALALTPGYIVARGNLGLALNQVNRWEEAIEVSRQGIALQPAYGKFYKNLGVALIQLGRVDEAIEVYRDALARYLDEAELRNDLGVALSQSGQPELAVAEFRQALAQQPDFPMTVNNLGAALTTLGRLDEAREAFRRAISLQPHYAEAHYNLGNVLKDKGCVDKAVAAYRQALTHDNTDPKFHDNLVYTLHFLAGADDTAIAATQRVWEQQLAEPLRHEIPPFLNDRTPERRLRVGYVSPDFRDHAVGRFLLPLLENHDRERYEITAYAGVTNPDGITERMRPHIDTWRNTVGLTDEQLAALIRADQIDILVDLTLHMEHNRLLVFARKPAPVQVTYLAYAGSSGLATMDYRLSDPYLDPPGRVESIYSEQTVRLPETYWCYQPPQAGMLPVTRTSEPAAIRFGCLNNFCKVNAPLLDVWAKILCAVPHSQLLIHTVEGDHRQAVLDRFSQQGIATERIEFVGKIPLAEYFRTYQTLDIALDTTPYGGGTTTCDALWMGVPVVTLAGERAVGRGGVSILSNLGLPELIAQTTDEYVQIAVALASDQVRLLELRSTLRERMQASPIMDAARFARNIEAAYRQMWRTWCERSGK